MRDALGAPRLWGVALGGAAGASVRWALITQVGTGMFPWPLFAINVLGSVLLGVLLAAEEPMSERRWWLHDVGAIGFCGGLTTFSTYAVEVVLLARDGRVLLAALYGSASVVAAIAGIALGARAVGRWRALRLPLEEAT